MKISVKENREIIMINAKNTQNENDVEVLHLVVPEKYNDFNKKIVFITPNGVEWDLIEGDRYTLKRAITQYEKVDFYIWLTKGEQDFRSAERTLILNKNHRVDGEVTPEEETDMERVISILEGEITKTENLDLDINKVGTITTVTLTDKNGNEKIVEILDGQNGAKGEDGTDGFSPIITETQTANGYDISITDKNGTNIISLLNGQNGVNGADGKDGKDAKINGYNTLSILAGDNITIEQENAELTINGTASYDDTEIRQQISGKQNEITNNNKLSSDLVDDINKTNLFVTSNEKQTWNNKSNFSGNYNDLSNKPTIPSELKDLSDDSTHRLVTDTEKQKWNTSEISIDDDQPVNNEKIWIKTEEGENLLDYTDMSTAATNVGITVDTDGNIKSTSMSSDSRVWNYSNCNYYITLPAGTYTLNEIFIVQATITSAGLGIYKSDGTEIFLQMSNNIDNIVKTFTLESSTNIGIMVKIYNGTCRLMLNEGNKALPFVPYGSTKNINNQMYINTNNSYEQISDMICTGPVSNGAKIWFKYSKNLFNKNNYNLYQGFIQGDTFQFISQTYGRLIYMKVKPNTTYVVSRTIVTGGSFAIGTGKIVPTAGQYATQYGGADDLNNPIKKTITTGSQDIYLYLYLLWAEGNNANLLPQILESIMVEEGDEMSTYEGYTKREILIKDDKGRYYPLNDIV